MQHNDNNLVTFPKSMNEFINIEHAFRSVNDLSISDNSKLQRLKESTIVHGSYNPTFFYTSTFLNTFRQCYYSAEKPDISNIYNPNDFNIAIHIRRGDVNASKFPSRYTSNSQYIDFLQKCNVPDNSVIHVFSEGKESDFSEFVSTFPNVKLHISTDVQETFHCLVKADYLLLSKSSYCYCAGMLNKNQVNCIFIKSWWHRPLNHWVTSYIH